MELNRRIVDFLLLNAYSCGSPGLAHGKAGMAMAFFEIARAWQDEALEEHAFELLQEALVYGGKNVSFSNGSAGIGYLLLYLTRNRYLKADYIELFEEQQQNIIKTILSKGYEGRQATEYAEMLLFFRGVADYIPLKTQQEVELVLMQKLKSYYDGVNKKFYEDVNVEQFYHCSALLLNIYRDTQEKKEEMERIIDICRFQRENSIVLESIDLGVGLMEYGKMHPECKDAFETGKQLAEMAVRNMVPQIMSLRERINFLYYCGQCDEIVNMDGCDILKNQVVGEWQESDVDQLEHRLVASLRHQAFYCGMGQGLARLLLMMAYWESLQRREKLSQIDFLFY